MSGRGRGGGQGRLKCVGCGGVFPPTRRNLKAKKLPGGFKCVSCEKGKKMRVRPSDYR